MTVEIVTTDKTEADLEARANAALRVAMPWVKVDEVKHQLTFSFKLGHKIIGIDGEKSSRRQGRLDILIEHVGKRLAILELKRPGKPLSDEDRDQGLSYARVLHPRPPVVIVSNGEETRTYATHSGELFEKGVSAEQEFADLMSAAMKVAESDLSDAIATLMGPGSDVWMSAVRAATDLTLDEMSGDWNDGFPTLTKGFHIPRKATALVRKALKGSRRVIAVEGAPLIGKTHVLRELATGSHDLENMAVLFVEASGTAAIGIAAEVARVLSSALGWRIETAEAKRWLESFGNGDGPMLVVAVDALALEHDTIRHELQALSSQTSGNRLKFVIEADSSVIDRLWKGESGRKETPFSRRGDRVEVKPLDDEEFGWALQTLATLRAGFMHGANRADEYRLPWLLRSMAASVVNSPDAREEMFAILPPLLSLDLFRHVRNRFLHDSMIEQAACFARAVLDEYSRDDRSAEITLRAMHSFMVRKRTLRDHADSSDTNAMKTLGLVGTVLDSTNRPVLTGRVPELIASELARLIASELHHRMGSEDADADAADWLVGVSSHLPFGDVIAAQALADLCEFQVGISVAFLNRLLGRAPSVRSLRPGSKAVAWSPEIGHLEIETRADGVTVIKTPGGGPSVEITPEEGGEVYGDLDAWLILSHIAGIPIGAVDLGDENNIIGLVHPAILALVGTSPIPLRRVSGEIERSGVHTHDTKNGLSLVCSQDGIIEPITFSLLRFLEDQKTNADGWLEEACNEGSAPLLNRIAQALRQIASMNPEGETAKWAKNRYDDLVFPAFERAFTAAVEDA